MLKNTDTGKIELSQLGITGSELTKGKNLTMPVTIALLGGGIRGYEALRYWLYRLAPKPANRPKGTEGYIDEGYTPISLDEIKKKFGGGLFKVYLNSDTETDTETGNKKTVAVFNFEIDGDPKFEQPESARAPLTINSPAVPTVPGGLRFSLEEIKLLKEVLGVNGSRSGPDNSMEVFMKGFDFAEKILKKGAPPAEDTPMSIFKELIEVFRDERKKRGNAPAEIIQVPAQPGVVPSPETTGGADTVLQAQIDRLMEFIMDSYDENKLLPEVSAKIRDQFKINPDVLKNPDPAIVDYLWGQLENFDWVDVEPEKKRNWLSRLVAETKKITVPTP